MNKVFDTLTNIGILSIGGVTGTLTRYFVSSFAAQTFGSHFPYGTLIVNTTGCLLAGFFMSLFVDKTNPWWLLSIVGFCGALTTFSALVLETATLISAGSIISSFLNLCLNVLIGFGLFYLGMVIGKMV